MTEGATPSDKVVSVETEELLEILLEAPLGCKVSVLDVDFVEGDNLCFGLCLSAELTVSDDEFPMDEVLLVCTPSERLSLQYKRSCLRRLLLLLNAAPQY